MRRTQDSRFYLLLTIVMVVTGCASVPPYKALVPQQAVNSSRTNSPFNGSVEIHSIIKPERMGYGLWEDLPINAYVDNVMLETALKESVANSAIFARVEQKNADYVLDVWVDDVESYQPKFGIGSYGAMAFSIWRLTRVRDGKVLVCEFVDGSGLINTMVSAPRTKSLVAALKDVIQKGMGVLADTSKTNLAAMHVAGIRPSMGSAVPEGLRAWEEKVKNNWSNLHKGLSLEEVENIIGPVRTSGALERIYLKFKRWGLPLQADDLTYYDEELAITIKLPYLPQPLKRTFPYYDEHSYVCNIIEPPTTLSNPENRKVYYYMTHLYAMRFSIFKGEGLQAWVRR
jgi:hypothetical protein